MFSFVALIGLLASIILFGSMVSSNFQDSSLITAFISMLFSTILCFKLAKMDQKISDNEIEIQKLKKHLDIPNDDTSNDIAKYYPDNNNNNDY